MKNSSYARNLLICFFIFFLLIFAYRFTESVFNSVKCSIFSCEQDLRDQLKEKDLIIDQLKETIEKNKQTHEREIKNYKENIESLKTLLEEKAKNEKNELDIRERILKDSRKKRESKPTPSQNLLLSSNKVPQSQPEVLDPEILIEGIWDFYCLKENHGCQTK